MTIEQAFEVALRDGWATTWEDAYMWALEAACAWGSSRMGGL